MNEKTKIDKLKQVLFLALVLAWMTVIFYFSNQPGEDSSNTSSRTAMLITEVITYGQSISIEEKQNIVIILNPIVRKMAHYSLYTLGGFLIINYINTYNWQDKKKISYSTLIGAIYAITDEVHQFFIEGRTAKLTDVLLDTLGVVTGVCIFLCIVEVVSRITRKRKNKNNGG